jgi:hypothetical protein
MKNRIHNQEETNVYVTNGGHVCIEQHIPLEQEPSKVFISPENVARLCRMLKSLRDNAVTARNEFWDNEDKEQLGKDGK